MTTPQTPVPLPAPGADGTGLPCDDSSGVSQGVPGADTSLSAPGTKTPEDGVLGEGRPASGQQPVPAVGDRPAAGTGARQARKPPLTGVALLASRMPENGGSDSLDYKLREMLRESFTGLLLWQHNSDSRRAHCGFPDWVITRRYRLGDLGRRHGGVLVRELKRETTQPTEDQMEWLCALKASGIDAGIWRPSDLLSGRIARELAALAGLGGAA